MGALQDFRRQHPEYDDMNDVELADALHTRFYSDVPRDRFRAQIGLRDTQRSAAYPRAYQRERDNEETRRAEPVARFTAPFTDFVDQIPRNMGVSDEIAGANAYLGQGASNLIRRAQGQPIETPAAVAAQAASDFDQQQGRRYAREHPIRNVGSIIASIPAAGGSPAQSAGRVGMLRAGLSGAAINAPFALSRQDGPIQERLPGAARETAVVGVMGAGLQGGANALLPRLSPQAARRAAQFEQAGVRPSLAAISGGAPAGATKMVGENFLAGARVRRALQGSIDDTGEAARRIAQGYGQHGPREQVGEQVQRGVQRFARDRLMPQPRPGSPESISTREWSFAAKSRALYDRVFAAIARDERGFTSAGEAAPITTQATQRVLQDIQQRISAPELADLLRDTHLERFSNALQADQSAGAILFSDLRALRTHIREMQHNPAFNALRQTVDDASLQRLEAALTQDIFQSAEAIGGQATADQLRRVDQFYRAGQQRIQRALEPFAQGGGAQAYRRVIDLASQGGRENSRALNSLRQSLRPDEWRQVAATVIDELGSPSFGNPNVLESGAFSVERFVTNYARLSQEGRQALFGGRSGWINLQGALDNLAHVAGYQKGVEAMVNSSRSGVNAQNFGSLVGLANPGTMVPTAGLLTGMALTGEMLTNPAFVRWMVSAQRGGGVGGMRRQLAALAQLAARDPALAPYYDALARRVGEKLQPRSEPRTTRTELLPQ